MHMKNTYKEEARTGREGCELQVGEWSVHGAGTEGRSLAGQRQRANDNASLFGKANVLPTPLLWVSGRVERYDTNASYRHADAESINA